jgi:hypothetical protein
VKLAPLKGGRGRDLDFERFSLDGSALSMLGRILGSGKKVIYPSRFPGTLFPPRVVKSSSEPTTTRSSVFFSLPGVRPDRPSPAVACRRLPSKAYKFRECLGVSVNLYIHSIWQFHASLEKASATPGDLPQFPAVCGTPPPSSVMATDPECLEVGCVLLASTYR